MADDKTNPPTSAPAPAVPPTVAPTTQAGTTPGGIRISTAVTSGTRIMGTYEVEQLISKGGMGEVYRGRNIHTGEPVAIKIVLPHLAQDEMISQLFQKEAKVLGRLNAEAIVRYHVFTNDPEIGRPSLIMEFVEGTSMNDRMKQGPMSEAEVRVLLRRLAGGLDKAHGVGVVHRDLSPDNVILEDGLVEHAKIIDFGIAKSSMKGTDATLLQGQFAGKFSFVAPEQLGAYGGGVDARTDIYSLALMMVAACQGRNLNMGKSIVEAVKARNAVPDLPMVPAGLRPLLEHMLEPDPASRPASMAEVIRLIDNPQLVPGRAAPSDDDGDRTRIVSAASLAGAVASAAGSAPGGSAPKGSLPPAAVSSRPAASDAVFVGIPGSGAKAPAPAKGGKGGMMAVAAVAVLAIGGAGAWFGGLIPHGDEVTDQPTQEQPGTGTTDQPGTGTTDQPGTGTTDQPGTGTTDQPGTGTTDQPGTGTTDQPGSGTTDQPGTGTTDQPGTGTTDQPGTGTSDQPGTGTTDQPGTGTTDQPGTGTTDQPGTGTTDQPGTGTTDQPGTGTTDQPGTGTTDQPGTGTTTTETPAADPMDQQAAWVRGYNPGPCAFVAVRSKAEPAVALEGFARDIAPFTALLSEFTAQFGKEPALDTHAVNEPQCPIVEFMDRLKTSDELPPAIVLDNSTGVVKSGETVSGRIEGLAGRAVTLFLVNGVGGATNLKNFVARSSDGTVSFSFSVNLAAGSEPTPQLLLAMVTKDPVTKLDVVPNGVTARALVPFMETEIERARQNAIADLRYFRLEN